MLVPFVNLIIFILIWMDIAKILGKPAWLGILILVPFVNLAMMWYLALSAPEKPGSLASKGIF